MKFSTSRLFVAYLTALDHFAEISERIFRRVLGATMLHDLTSARRKVRERWSSVSVVVVFLIAAPSYGANTHGSGSISLQDLAGGFQTGGTASIGWSAVANATGFAITVSSSNMAQLPNKNYSATDVIIGSTQVYYSDSGSGQTTIQVVNGAVVRYRIRMMESGIARSSTQSDWTYSEGVLDNAETKKFRWGPLSNPGANPLNYQVWKVSNNLPVADLLLAPGATNQYIEVTGQPSTAVYADYVLKWWMPGLIWGAGGQWVTSTAPSADTGAAPTGGETVTSVPILGDPNYVVPESTPFTPTNTIPVPTPTNLPTGTAATGGGSVWKMGSGLTAALDIEGYREGIDKLLADRASAKVVEGAFNTHYGADGLARAKGYGGTETGEGTGTGAKTGIEEAYAIPGAAISGASVPGAGSFSPFALVTSKFGTIDFNPQNHPTVVSLMDWIKAFFAWTLTVVYSYWVFKHFRELTSVGAVSQIRGHSLALGAGGQVSALGNAVVWTTIMLSLPVVFTAALTSAGLEFPSVTGLLTSPVAQIASLGPGGAAAAALINAMIPWEVLILVLVGPIMIQAFSIPIYMGVQSAIRWLIA